jgi:capsule polysaccharide export protein KpsE/RkpR
MARSKIDDVIVGALGDRREQIWVKIKEIETRPQLLSELQQELADIEAKLKEIDPTIPSKDDEAVAVEAAGIEAIKGG